MWWNWINLGIIWMAWHGSRTTEKPPISIWSVWSQNTPPPDSSVDVLQQRHSFHYSTITCDFMQLFMDTWWSAPCWADDLSDELFWINTLRWQFSRWECKFLQFTHILCPSAPHKCVVTSVCLHLLVTKTNLFWSFLRRVVWGSVSCLLKLMTKCFKARWVQETEWSHIFVHLDNFQYI